LWVWLGILAVQLPIGLLYTYVPKVVEPGVRTTAIAALTSAGLLGAFLAPIGAGGIIGIAGYRLTFLIAGAVGGAGILLALRAPRPQ
jgi:MFS family permease